MLKYLVNFLKSFNNVYLASELPNSESIPKKEHYPKVHIAGIHKILIIGETGSGKSTLVNTLTNYMKSGNLDNLKITIPTAFLSMTELFNLHSESNVKKTSQAQTQKATEYKFEPNKNCCVYVVDTPGLNDTNGIEQDNKNLDIILSAAEKAEALSAVVLVLNGTEARVTPNIKAIINKLQGSMPDSILDNIVVVMTMCRQDTCNFTDYEQLGIKPFKVIYMNNTSFSSNPKTWSTSSKEMLRLEWKNSMNACADLVNTITEMSKVSTNEFHQIKNLRAKILSTIHKAKLDILYLQTLQEESEKAISISMTAKDELEKTKNFTQKKTITKTSLVPASYHSTICKKCNTVCHDGCGLYKGTELSGCLCMINGKCTECEGRCDHTQHYHDYKKLSFETVDIEIEIQDLKDKYLAAKALAGEALGKIDEIDLTRKSIQLKIENVQTDIKNLCTELKGICKNFNLVNELKDLIYSLKSESENLTTIQARKTADDFINIIIQIADTFSKKV